MAFLFGTCTWDYMITFEGLPGKVDSVCDDVFFSPASPVPLKRVAKKSLQDPFTLASGFCDECTKCNPLKHPATKKNKLENLNKPFYFPSANTPTRFEIVPTPCRKRHPTMHPSLRSLTVSKKRPTLSTCTWIHIGAKSFENERHPSDRDQVDGWRILPPPGSFTMVFP